MYPKTLTLTVTSATEEILLEQALALARDLRELADTAPAGQILDRCEEAAVLKGRELTRQALQQAVTQRLEAAQKKGRRRDNAGAAELAKAKGPANEAC